MKLFIFILCIIYVCFSQEAITYMGSESVSNVRITMVTIYGHEYIICNDNFIRTAPCMIHSESCYCKTKKDTEIKKDTVYVILPSPNKKK